MSCVIRGGEVLRGGAFERADLAVADGRIAETPGADAAEIDATGLLVLPGIVDIHGDAFERQIMPRSGVAMDLDLALVESDRQIIANGITTAFHGLSVSWEPGLRSLENGRRFVETYTRLRPRLAADTRLHIRAETFAFEAEEDVSAWLDLDPRPILAFNDHTGPLMKGGKLAAKLAGMERRAGLSKEDYHARVLARWDRRDDVQPMLERLAGVARKKGAVILSHDELTVADRLRFRALGSATSEFPMRMETAAAAREAGEHTVLGAPNILIGGSHTGAIGAADAIGQGLCTVLASDYYYPAQLQAAFKVEVLGLLPLAEAWALVSENAARAAGLTDRGTLAPGKRADVILIDRSGPVPQVVEAMVAGRRVYATRPC